MNILINGLPTICEEIRTDGNAITFIGGAVLLMAFNTAINPPFPTVDSPHTVEYQENVFEVRISHADAMPKDDPTAWHIFGTIVNGSDTIMTQADA